MRLQKTIAKSLLGIGLIGILGCEESTLEPEKVKIKESYVAKFPMNVKSGTGVAVGDMNGDGRLDIIVAAHDSRSYDKNGKVYVFLNNGDGTYSPSEKYQGEK